MAHLIVDKWFSFCSACGGNADPYERVHVHGGWGSRRTPLDEKGGCGVVFTHHQPVFIGGTKEDLRRMFWGD